MDWKNANFDWNRAKAFLVVAEQSSLSGAARELGLAQPTIGRQIASLEEELGVTLIDRAANGVILTETGLALAEHVRLMGEAANKVALTASGNAQSIEGTVRISATETDCVYLLVDILAELRELQPGIRIELLATDSVSDLRKREADIALRNGRPTSPTCLPGWFEKTWRISMLLQAISSAMGGRSLRTTFWTQKCLALTTMAAGWPVSRGLAYRSRVATLSASPIPMLRCGK